MPNDNVIDKLSIEIEAQTGDVTRRLGKVVSALKVLSTTLSGMSMPKLGIGKATIANLNAFQTALQSLDISKLSSLSSILSGMKGLRTGISSASAANITNFSQGIKNLDIAKLQHLSSINFSNLQPLAKAGHAISALNGQLTTNANVTSKVETAQKRLSTATHSVRRATHSAHRSFSLANTALGKLFNSIKRIAFYRMIRSAIKAVTQGFGEGIENLYRWSQAWNTSFAPAMDQLATAQLYLKNGFASMFSPLIEYMIPILDSFIDRLVDAFNVVQELLARLTGAKTWNKAVKQPVKYKEALDDTAKSAKALQNILMDFDEINAINSPNSGFAGGSGNETDYSNMFQLVPTDVNGNSPLDKLLTKLTPLSGFFSDLKTKIQNAYAKVKQFGDYVKSLNYKPLFDALSGLWTNTLSPMIDYFTENTNSFLEPLAQFFVEEGLPTAIDLVSVSLGKLFELIQPSLENGFFDDIAGKLSKINGHVDELSDFIDELDVSSLGESLSTLWTDGVSPLGDWLIDNMGWVQTNVLEPITKFFVEKGLPAAIDNITEALKSFKESFEPVADGLKTFWEENGDWIMSLFEEQTMTALNNIKDLFERIGNWFKNNGDKFKSIIGHLSSMFEKLGPVIKTISGMTATHAWETFVDSILNILDAITPILDILSGVLSLLDAMFFSRDAEDVKQGLSDIGQALTDAILGPMKVIIRALAVLLDAFGFSEEAHTLRVAIGDEFDAIEGEVEGTGAKIVETADGTFEALDVATGEYVTITGARISQEENELNKSFAKIYTSGEMIGKTFAENMKITSDWLEYCRVMGVDPVTGSFISATKEGLELEKQMHDLGQASTMTASNMSGAFYGALTAVKGEEIGHVFGSGFVNGVDAHNRGQTIGHTFGKAAADNLNADGLVTQFTSALSPTAGIELGQSFGSSIMDGMNPSGMGSDLAKQMAQSAQNALNLSPLQLTATVSATINSINANDQWRAALAAAGISTAGFASGGFPTPSSLFWAGESGIPELMGTIGGRTAVAGGEEITGIRNAILEQGQREEGLLRQLISAVANKDLTLVANSRTGRWVNQSLKAYAGVTG
nr:MAG TPA: minor tail protein [Bacteriophage sp.]